MGGAFVQAGFSLSQIQGNKMTFLADFLEVFDGVKAEFWWPQGRTQFEIY